MTKGGEKPQDVDTRGGEAKAVRSLLGVLGKVRGRGERRGGEEGYSAALFENYQL